jgi:hypothetical protein
MKRIAIIAAALVVSSAFAQVQEVQASQVVLTDRPCLIGNATVQRLREAYATEPSGELLQGCWTTERGLVYIVWNDEVPRSAVYAASDLVPPKRR